MKEHIREIIFWRYKLFLLTLTLFLLDYVRFFLVTTFWGNFYDDMRLEVDQLHNEVKMPHSFGLINALRFLQGFREKNRKCPRRKLPYFRKVFVLKLSGRWTPCIINCSWGQFVNVGPRSLQESSATKATACTFRLLVKGQDTCLQSTSRFWWVSWVFHYSVA